MQNWILSNIFFFQVQVPILTLQLPHNQRDGVSNHRLLQYLLNCCLRRRSKKTLKLCVMAFVGNSPVTGELFAQRASNAGNVSIDEAIMSWDRDNQTKGQNILQWYILLWGWLNVTFKGRLNCLGFTLVSKSNINIWLSTGVKTMIFDSFPSPTCIWWVGVGVWRTLFVLWGHAPPVLPFKGR